MANSIIVQFDIRNDMDKQNHKYKHDKKRIKRMQKNANAEYDQFDNRSI